MHGVCRCVCFFLVFFFATCGVLHGLLERLVFYSNREDDLLLCVYVMMALNG